MRRLSRPCGKVRAGLAVYEALRNRVGVLLDTPEATDGFQAVDVGDVAKLILTIAERRWRRVFNAVAPGESATFRDYLEVCIQAVGSRPENPLD